MDGADRARARRRHPHDHGRGRRAHALGAEGRARPGVTAARRAEARAAARRRRGLRRRTCGRPSTPARSARTRRAWRSSRRRIGSTAGIALDEIARIWKGGCIIRALLEVMREAYARSPSWPTCCSPRRSRPCSAAPGRVAPGGGRGGGGGPRRPAPRHSPTYDRYRRERVAGNLTQAQRDYFGAHTYQRIDAGTFHSDWANRRTNPKATTAQSPASSPTTADAVGRGAFSRIVSDETSAGAILRQVPFLTPDWTVAASPASGPVLDAESGRADEVRDPASGAELDAGTGVPGATRRQVPNLAPNLAAGAFRRDPASGAEVDAGSGVRGAIRRQVPSLTPDPAAVTRPARSCVGSRP